MRRSLLLCMVALSMLGGNISQARADLASWMVTGRTNSVTNERRSFGDVIGGFDLNTKIPDSSQTFGLDVEPQSSGSQSVSFMAYVPLPSPTAPADPIRGECNGSFDPICDGILQINGCNFASQPAAARQSLTLLLGSCTKSCIAATGLAFPAGESFTRFIWTCATANQAECIDMAGTFIGSTKRVDLVQRAPSCQF